MAETFTLKQYGEIEPIVKMTEHNSRCVRVMDNGQQLRGTARSLGDENGAFGRFDEDVRDMHLRVTLENGFEAFWPVRELMPLVRAGKFLAYDWS